MSAEVPQPMVRALVKEKPPVERMVFWAAASLMGYQRSAFSKSCHPLAGQLLMVYTNNFTSNPPKFDVKLQPIYG